jgi:hypothetical protein
MQQSDEMSISIDKKMKNTRRSSALECVGSSKRNGMSNNRGMEADMIVAILKPFAALQALANKSLFCGCSDACRSFFCYEPCKPECNDGQDKNEQ